MYNDKKRPKLGIIEPVGKIPVVLENLYGDEIDFFVADGKVESLTVQGYENAIQNLPVAIEELLEAEVDAVSIMGTSLTFFRGKEFNENLKESIEQKTGLPTTTMTSAIIEGLNSFNVKNVAVATAYSNEVSQLLIRVLKEYNLNPIGLEYLNTDLKNLDEVNTEILIEMGLKAVRDSDSAEALLISCGGLKTLDATLYLEEKLDIPVVSSAVAGAWASARLVGHSGHNEKGGRLLQLF